MLDEQGPSYVEAGEGDAQLFFSRSSAAVPGDLFVSTDWGDGFSDAAPVSELNSPGNDIQPNVRKDGRELVFSTNHAHPGAQGTQDLYVATRASTDDRGGRRSTSARASTPRRPSRARRSRGTRGRCSSPRPGA